MRPAYIAAPCATASSGESVSSGTCPVSVVSIPTTAGIRVEPGDWLSLMHFRLKARAAPDHDNYTAVSVFVLPEAPEEEP